ncbi:hypothetical protein WA026_006023 [Henosepilachna vigintioctopunctata]|uniref:ABC transporter domain-containing protein n=1 Tax=Henosepilachna vigintioctopunctata TaxID=420089 RepID=A0AAW1TQ68_9CUCU
MGTSGSGKTTLMNVLAGYTKQDYGKLLINNERRNENRFRRTSCYIMQNDQLQPLLTVSEAMNMAANLKMSTNISQKMKQERVKEILLSLGLWKHKKVKSDSLSGGERKRLSIAMELLKNPQVMFFDEPTSGLDSQTSKQCLSLLQELALTGRTIICSIHQPSAFLLEMFHHLYVLDHGHCVYQGGVGQLLPFLKDINLICPTYHNPADFLMEITSGVLGNYFNELIEKSGNGLNENWRHDKRDIHSSLEHLESEDVTPVAVPSSIFNKIKFIDKHKNDEENMVCSSSDYPTSSLNQLLVLLKRNYIILSRDRTLTYTRIVTHLLIALFIGFLYYGIGIEAQNMLNNFNYLFYSLMFLMFTAFSSVTTTFPSELPIISKENFNKWYSLKSYYLATTMSDIPIQIFATLIYSILTYYMTKQPTSEPYRLAFFLFMCVLVSLVSQSFGLFIGASMSLKNGVIFGPFFILPFTIFSGFFIHANAAHPYFRWLFHVSFLKYGLEGLVLSVLGYGRERLPCEADYCHYVHPKAFLKNMNMDQADYWIAVAFLLGLFTMLRIAAYFALALQIKIRKL